MHYSLLVALFKFRVTLWLLPDLCCDLYWVLCLS